MSYDLQNINEIVKKEKLDVCVISYGGSCSNQLVDILTKNNYNCRTPTWGKILCHCPHIIDIDIPIIYIYDNPVKSFLSMKRRKYDIINQKKLNNYNKIKITDENLLTSMIRQFNSFASNKNILLLKTHEIFEDTIVEKLQTFLNKPDLNGFPIPYKTPHIILEGRKYTNAEFMLFLKYKQDIDKINNFPKT
jgi:hypothetical protein